MKIEMGVKVVKEFQSDRENENHIGNDNIMELIKKEVAIAEKLKNIINEISIEYRSTGEIIIRLYRPKEDNKKIGDMINDIVDPLVEEEEKKKKYNTITVKPKRVK